MTASPGIPAELTSDFNVHEKPETRKARGAYWTPIPIVRHIVDRTLGRLLIQRRVIVEPGRGGTDGIAPRMDEPLRVLDPACGSGVFLLGAYQHLLSWYLDYYASHHPKSWGNQRARPIITVSNTKRRFTPQNYKLTTAERLRILRDHLYGVDIDPRAVKVTRTSLWQKALEGSPEQPASTCSHASPTHVGSCLDGNIRCGNALIGPDFYDEPANRVIPAEQQASINAFDWQTAFPEVFNSRGGFEVVIGNPPYLSYSGRQAAGISESERAYLFARYARSAWPAAHAFFTELAVCRLSRRLTSFIVPDQVGHLDGYRSLRRVLTRNSFVVEVRYWGESIFPGAVTPALTFVADSSHRGETEIRSLSGRIQSRMIQGGDVWTATASHPLLEKISAGSSSLGKMVSDVGVHTGNCAGKLITPRSAGSAPSVPILEGRQITRYGCAHPERSIRLEYQKTSSEYFHIHPREKYEQAQFLIRQTARHPMVGPRNHAVYFRNSLLALYPPRDGTDIRCLVGILNSSLMRFAYVELVHEASQRAFPQVKVASLRRLPIRRIDLGNDPDRLLHGEIVRRVSLMLEECAQSLDKVDAEGQVVSLHRIRQLDACIDNLVYELYGLSPAEISAVEKELGRSARKQIAR